MDNDDIVDALAYALRLRRKTTEVLFFDEYPEEPYGTQEHPGSRPDDIEVESKVVEPKELTDGD